MIRRRIIGAACAAIMATAASPVAAGHRSVIAPYIEVGEVLTADLRSGDVLTYSTAAAGLDASIQSDRTQLQLSYRYERRFSWNKHVGDDDVHSGLARGAVRVAPGLAIEAGALATRSRSDIRGAAPEVLAGNVDNVVQVYSGYVGPTLATNLGPLSVGASYRYGYTKVEAPHATGVSPGAPKLDVFDSSQSHVATASVGTRPGTILPVGLTVSGAYERDTARQLRQRYEGKFVRGDVFVPIVPTVAATAGVGYEKIEVSQQDPLRDAAGNPVVDGAGRFVSDPASPRRIAYATDGLIYDAGVVWRPSARTRLEARAGRRYGGQTYTGSFSYTPSHRLALQVGVYDSIETFGRELRDRVASLPTSFIDQRDAFGQQFSNCTFGGTGSGGNSAGGCLNGVFQSVSTASYRARGADAIVTATHGGLSFGVGAGYANRRFYAPASTDFTIDGVSDESYYGQAFASAAIDRNSGVNGDIFVDYFKSGIGSARGVLATGATGVYYHNFGRLGTTAGLGIYAFRQEGVDEQVSGQAQLGMRYQF